jgi:hypothetical protein
MKTPRDITTILGFYNTYFDLLPLFNNQLEAFNYLNKQYAYIFGKPKYKNFKSFKHDF